MSDLPPIIHRHTTIITEAPMSVSITSLGHVEPGGILTVVDPATYLKALQALDGLDVVVTITAKHPKEPKK